MRRRRPDRFKFFGENAELTPLGEQIMAEDLDALERGLGTEWHINERMAFAEHVVTLPINLAVVENRNKVTEYLVRKGADLNFPGDPVMCYAVQNADPETFRMLLEAGADIHATNRVGANAYERALSVDRIDMLPQILDAGLAVDADGGIAFRKAVYYGQREAVQWFLDEGMDPNLRSADMVFPDNTTAVSVAALCNDLELVRLLAARGADTTLDSNGLRPIHHAVAHGNEEMVQFFRGREPDAWHDVPSRIGVLRDYGAPDALIEFLQRDERRISLPEERGGWIELSPLLMVYEMTWQGDACLSLLADHDEQNLWGGLVWSKRNRSLAFVDGEHDRIVYLDGWDDFVADPAKYFDRYIEQYFAG